MNTSSKIIASFFVLFLVIGGYYWIRTPHLSSNISLKCKTPETPDQLVKLIIVREMYDEKKAHIFANTFAGFTFHSGSRDGTYRHELYSGLYNLTFYGVGMSHFEFNMPFKELYKTKSLTETQCIEKSNQLVEEIKDYFNSPLEYKVNNVEKIFPYESSTPVDLINSNYYYRIYYDIYYYGVELIGKGTDAWVDVCDREVLGYHLHFPVLEERGIGKVHFTPIEALNHLKSECTVFEIKFGYYTDFVESDNYSVVEYGYLIKGIKKGDNMETFVDAMSGYR